MDSYSCIHILANLTSGMCVPEHRHRHNQIQKSTPSSVQSPASMPHQLNSKSATVEQKLLSFSSCGTRASPSAAVTIFTEALVLRP